MTLTKRSFLNWSVRFTLRDWSIEYHQFQNFMLTTPPKWQSSLAQVRVVQVKNQVGSYFVHAFSLRSVEPGSPWLRWIFSKLSWFQFSEFYSGIYPVAPKFPDRENFIRSESSLTHSLSYIVLISEINLVVSSEDWFHK